MEIMFSRDVTLKLAISTISVVISFLGIIVLLAFQSTVSLVLFFLFYILTNIAGGLICSQCPFRGKFCPGVLQLYFMPFLSKVFYRRPKYSRKTIERSAVLVGIFGSAYYLIGFVSLFLIYWNSTFLTIVLVLLFLFFTHFFLSFSNLCPNCMNKENCPMARVSDALGKE